MDRENLSTPTLAAIERACQGFLALGKKNGEMRRQGVQAIAKGIERGLNAILEANTLDLEMSREMAVADTLLEWLKLTPERLYATVEILEELAELPDPIERVLNAPYQLNPAQTYCQRVPLGVIALVYEAFPELGALAAGFCLKTGNSLILRGCGASSYSNTAIAQHIQEALEEAGLPPGCVQAISSDDGNSIQDLVSQHQSINLVIPYGRPSLIEQVTQIAAAPVLKSAMGNCYLYWSASGDLDLVRWMIVDSHESKPDPVNAIEKVLVSPIHSSSLLVRLFGSLKEKGFQLLGDPPLAEEFPEYLAPVRDSEWSKSYLDRRVAFKLTDSLPDAIAWIDRYSSGHADCIATESYQESRQFAMGVDSALAYINTSPRFFRHPKQGESIFLGISNQKGHRRGLIGLETFTTLKQVVQGNGR